MTKLFGKKVMQENEESKKVGKPWSLPTFTPYLYIITILGTPLRMRSAQKLNKINFKIKQSSSEVFKKKAKVSFSL